MEKSESIKEIAAALCNFQKSVGKIKKSETNPFFKSKYADLSSILDTIQEPLFENGLSFVQFPTGKNELSTMLMHISGEWIKSTSEMLLTKQDSQGLGSAITYQRRYSLASILGLNIDVDDDGNAASKQPVKPNTTEKPKATEANIKAIQEKIKADFDNKLAIIEKAKTYYTLTNQQLFEISSVNAE
jgi:hypothetical protein